MSKSIKISFLILFSFFCQFTFGQNLLKSRQTSYFTYIYKLSDKEAKIICRKNTFVADSSFLHNLIDSFPTDSQYTRKLLPGYYLKTYFDKNKQKMFFTEVPDFDVEILNNNTDLCIQITDLQGNKIKNALVKIRLKNLKFDEKTQSYISKKSNQKGLLKVKCGNFTAYYNISRQNNNSALMRGFKTVTYIKPIRYVWIPIHFALFFPVDAIKSIIEGYPVGKISLIRYNYNRIYDFIENFYDYRIWHLEDSRFSEKYNTYIVFNKPKYRIGDTIMFKAIIFKKNGKPIKNPVNVKLSNYKKPIKLANLKPYRPGFFEYKFVLNDSLNLKIDKDYYLFLEKNDNQKYLSGIFKVEDYELKSTKLEIRLDSETQYKGKTLKLFVKGTDENNLNLLDSRLEIMGFPIQISEYFDKNVFVPDTLFNIKKNLDQIGETEIIIPDSIFPKANFNYTLKVRLLTSDNEEKTELKNIMYYHEKKEIEATINNDSILFEYKENGIRTNKEISVTADDILEKTTDLGKHISPFSLKIKQIYNYYEAQTNNISETFDINDFESNLVCYTKRTNDSTIIEINNPRKLKFYYNIYKKNKELAKGYCDSLKYIIKTKSKKNIYISINYIWAGEVKNETYKIPIKENELNITYTQPKIVYPGQKSKIEIFVKNHKGKPIENADLTAFSLTKKFNYSPVNLPFLYEKVKKEKTVINNFHFNNKNNEIDSENELTLKNINNKTKLDSIEYYKFLYPNNQIYRFEFTPKDSITQFAPYVVSNGEIEPIYVIYVDAYPVYFSWTTTNQPYSFKILPGNHKIKLRTADKNIIIDSVFINSNNKLIFSVDSKMNTKNVIIEKCDMFFSDYEKRLLSKYIMPYRNTFGERFAFIEQNKEVQLINDNNNSRFQIGIAGPIYGNFNFNLIDSFSVKVDYEPFFEYEFKEKILKMRSVDSKYLFPYSFNYTNNKSQFTDLIVTKEMIMKQWDNYLDNKRLSNIKYSNPQKTTNGKGQLNLKLSKTNEKNNRYPINLIITCYDSPDFFRIYPGEIRIIYDLPKGLYKIISLYSEQKYNILDSIYVKPNGINYYTFEKNIELKKDTFSEIFNNFMKKSILLPNESQNQNKEINKAFNIYQNNFDFNRNSNLIEGNVYDESGLPIPGVNVIVKGTVIGTITDLYGYYKINVPNNSNVLFFSFVGMKTQEVNIGYRSLIDVKMMTEESEIDEVVVTALGISRNKKSLGYSVSNIQTKNSFSREYDVLNSLQGKVAGININGSPGSSTSIRIRGNSAISAGQQPLYIIDGFPINLNNSEDLSGGTDFGNGSCDLNPDDIENMSILKGNEAVSLYGARASNGAIIITTKNKSLVKNLKGADYDQTFLNAANNSSSIRNNFSDFAFWQPKLTTDKNGKASFDVTFPDDVTSWDTYYLAVKSNKQSAQTQGNIKSYKPLLAQLSIPRFLIENDSTYVIGKVKNYMPDSINVTTKFEINNKLNSTKTRDCKISLIDTILVVANNDSLNLKYLVEKQDGYFDGELKNIPIYPIGLQETKGNFWVLNNDTTINIEAQNNKIHLYAQTGYLEVLEAEISRLIDYKYSCNEQIASKTIALLAEKQIAKYKNLEFKNNKKIENLLKLLQKNQNQNGLWGWWNGSPANYWISLHVLVAMQQAKIQGFDVKFDENKLSETLIWEFENRKDFSSKVKILAGLNYFNSKINFDIFINKLDTFTNISLNNQLNFVELKQNLFIECKTDFLKKYWKTTLFGNIYFSDDKNSNDLTNNNIQNTIIAYRVLKNDTTTKPETLAKIRNYFLENKQNGYWQNTYQTAQIIETILPDLIGNKLKSENSKLEISGSLNKSVTKFPFEAELNSGQKISISKTGDFPVYLTEYQQYWNKNPKTNK